MLCLDSMPAAFREAASLLSPCVCEGSRVLHPAELRTAALLHLLLFAEAPLLLHSSALSRDFHPEHREVIGFVQKLQGWTSILLVAFNRRLDKIMQFSLLS